MVNNSSSDSDSFYMMIGQWHPYYTQPGWKHDNTATLFPYFALTLFFATFVFCFELMLSCRQYQRLRQTHRALVPDELAHVLKSQDDDIKKKNETDDTKKKLSLYDQTMEKALKSKKYNSDKAQFGLLTDVVGFVQATGFLVAGFGPFMWHFSRQVLEHPMLCGPTQDKSGSTTMMTGVSYYLCPSGLGANGGNREDGAISLGQTLMFLLLTTLLEMVISFPFEWYSTFRIEAKHGFNKSTMSLFLTDKVKSFALGIVIGSPVLAGLLFLIHSTGPFFYLYVWFFLFCFSIVMVTIVPIWIMPLFNDFTPLTNGSLRTKIEALAAELHFPLTKLFVCDGSKRSSHSNAYFYGFFNSKRIVLFDTLLTQATDDEIVAILGHELGHWSMMHVYQGFMVQQVYTFFTFYLFGLCMTNNPDLFTSFGFQSGDHVPIFIGLMLFSKAITAPIDTLLGFLLTANTRRNEFQADAFAVKLGRGEALQSGLTKICIENLSNLDPDPWFSAVHYSHPPLVERLIAVKDLMKKNK